MATPLHELTASLERLEAVDEIAKKLGKSVRDALKPGALRDGLAGTWLGHSLHPVLTDVVMAGFTGAGLLDLLGGDEEGDGAQRLIAFGLAAYPLTAATGATDWADSEAVDPPVRRVGIVHAAANTAAFTLYGLSYAARRRGRRGAGRALGLAGMGVLSAGGYLGGHLAHARGIGVDQTSFDRGPTDWTPVADAAAVREDEALRVVADDTPVLLLRRGEDVLALHDRCSHRGCSLAGGELDADTVTCPCHGSIFGLRDGTVRRGPAATGQPTFAVRERDGRVEVRLAGE